MQGDQFRTKKWVLVTEVGFFNLRAKMKLGVMSNRMFCWGKIERERRRKPQFTNYMPGTFNNISL